MAIHRIIHAAALGALLLSWTAPAQAFRCIQSGGECLYWPRASVPIPYEVNTDGSVELSNQAALRVTRRGMESWQNACDDCVEVNFQRSASLLAQESDGVNSIEWVDVDWFDSSSVIGLTVTQYFRTGEIIEADMWLNDVHYIWTEINSPIPDARLEVDALSIITHEAGHFLGLAHSDDTEATMFASYQPGTNGPATLACDDLEGICHIYSCSDTDALCGAGGNDDDDDDDPQPDPGGGDSYGDYGGNWIDCDEEPDHPACRRREPPAPIDSSDASTCGCEQIGRPLYPADAENGFKAMRRIDSMFGFILLALALGLFRRLKSAP